MNPAEAARAPLVIRAAKPSDQAYVATRWHRNLHEDAGLVDWALDRRGSRVLIAAPADNQDRIEGWLCYENMPGAQIVHAAYVRAEQRRRGVLTSLLHEAGLARNMPVVVTSRSLPPWETRWKIIPMTLEELRSRR